MKGVWRNPLFIFFQVRETMLFLKSSIVLWCFFYVSSESLQTKLKSNLQNNYTTRQFNVSPELNGQLESEISVASGVSMWPNIEVGRVFEGRTPKPGSKDKLKDSQMEPKTKKSSPRISPFQRFGISYSRTAALKTATTKKADRKEKAGMTPKRGSNPKQKKRSKIKPKTNGSSPNISPFQRFGISDSTIKARKKKQGSNLEQKKRSQIKPKTVGSSSKISPFQRFGISNSRIKARKKATTKQAGGEGTTPKHGSNREHMKRLRIGPGDEMRFTPESPSQQLRRFEISDSRNKTKKNHETMKKQGSNPEQMEGSQIIPKTGSSPKVSPFQRFGISNTRINARKNSMTKKAGEEDRTPKQGLNEKQKEGLEIEPGHKGSTPQSPYQQFRRFGLSDSRNETRRKVKTGKKDPNDMGSLEGEIPEYDSGDFRRRLLQPGNSGSGSASGDYSGDSDLSNDYSGGSSSGDIDDNIDQHNVSKTHLQDAVPVTIASTTLHTQYTMCLDRCSVITAKLSGNYTGNSSVDIIDDVFALLSGNYTGDRSLDAIYDIIVQRNGSKTNSDPVKPRINGDNAIIKSTHNMSSNDSTPTYYGTRYSHKMCIDRCYAYYRAEPNGKSQSERTKQRVVDMTDTFSVSLPVTVHTTPHGDQGELGSNTTDATQTLPLRVTKVNASTAARRNTKRVGLKAGKGVTKVSKTMKNESKEKEYDENYNEYMIPTSRISTTSNPQETQDDEDGDHNSDWEEVVDGNATDGSSKNHSREEYSDKPLVCWSCSSIVSFDCEKLESIYGEPPEVNDRLITTCKSGYCGYFSWAMDYGYGTEMHQRTCADKPEKFCNDSNALLEMINTTSNVRKCSVCNTPLCNNSLLQSMNSVLIVLTFLKTITIQRYAAILKSIL